MFNKEYIKDKKQKIFISDVPTMRSLLYIGIKNLVTCDKNSFLNFMSFRV